MNLVKYTIAVPSYQSDRTEHESGRYDRVQVRCQRGDYHSRLLRWRATAQGQMKIWGNKLIAPIQHLLVLTGHQSRFLHAMRSLLAWRGHEVSDVYIGAVDVLNTTTLGTVPVQPNAFPSGQCACLHKIYNLSIKRLISTADVSICQARVTLT